MKTLLVVTLLIASALAARRYDGYKVYEVKAKDRAAFDALVSLRDESLNYDFWTEPRGLDRAVDIMVPPAFDQVFVQVLDAFGMEYNVKFTDVQQLIEESKEDMAPPKAAAMNPRVPHLRSNSKAYSVEWTKYHSYDDIKAFIDEIAAAHPNLVTKSVIGKSAENEDILMVKISTGGNAKNSIIVDGAFHPREWISPAFTTWLINELVENNAAHSKYTDNLDWYIVPLLNVDGYRYTWDVDGDRLWRKNRQNNTGSRCIGIDLNRNWGFHFDEGGSSDLACTDTFNGGTAFIAKEAAVLRDAIIDIQAKSGNKAHGYLTFHSYGQYWLTPWGYTLTPPDDYNELISVVQNATNALTAVYGTKYTIGVDSLLYIASGGSDDWTKGVQGIKFSNTVEMRNLNTFELPANQIIPNNVEVWEGVKVFADAIIAYKP